MNKIDLIIDALDVSESLFYDQKKLQEALQAARELKALKPVAWKKTVGGSEITRSEPVAFYLGFTIPLYALDEVTK